MEAIRITDPDQLKSTLSSSFSRPGAKLIEVMVNKLSPLSYSAALVLTPSGIPSPDARASFLEIHGKRSLEITPRRSGNATAPTRRPRTTQVGRR
jgi:hypothetical protein